MGASMHGSGNGSGRRKRGRHAPISEINVTPFVDVMLVLLIIFMVAAPLLTVGVPIDLPESQAKPLEANTEPLTISIKSDGVLFLQESPIEFEELEARLLAIAENGYEERIFVRADRNTEYGAIMRVMGRMNQAGFKRIGLVTVEEQGG